MVQGMGWNLGTWCSCLLAMLVILSATGGIEKAGRQRTEQDWAFLLFASRIASFCEGETAV